MERPPNPAGVRRPEEPSVFKQIISFAQKAVLIYFVSQAVGQFFASKAPQTPGPSKHTSDGASRSPGEANAFKLPPVTAVAAWPLGSELEMHFYMSRSPFPNDVFSEQAKMERLPHFVWDNITLGDWSDNSRSIQHVVDIPASVQRNQSALFAHIFVVKDHINPDPTSDTFNHESVHYFTKLLTRFLPKVKVRKEKNLLGAQENEEEKTEEVTEPQTDTIVPYWHSNLTLTLVSDVPLIPYEKLPPALTQFVTLVPGARDPTGSQGQYLPIIFPNDFWQSHTIPPFAIKLRSQLIEINSTTPTLPLQITFYPLSYMKFQMYASLTSGFDEAAKSGQGVATGELDEIKRMLTETNPFLLILTAVVSILHMVFEMLAFSSDPLEKQERAHWRVGPDGWSVFPTIVTNVFVQLVILLYLLDNNTDTSWMILMGQVMGMLIEAWKVTKAVDIRILPAGPGSRLPYRLDIQDKHVLSEDEKKTQQYDKEAFRYVSYAAVPLLAGYTIYSLMYKTHRGWYSFIISTMTSFVYLFGFAQLVPQLIINYKLKSVAHMPMKAMIYKTLGTVIDDLFALELLCFAIKACTHVYTDRFCIKMPILHRIACFRDDVVFLVFLYQRWIYRIDPTRVNEFGQVMAVDEKNDKAESKKDK
ncbi:cleft lip and palate associated transmembrane protein [Hysterangium stoloniferum]|nr:cleft lip and palate associated transmembrane protein [Hysterangium stoloniferum]